MTKYSTGFAFLIEGELEKAELVIAARAITDKLQSMAEDLAKVEADDVMPLLDQLKTAFGPQAADRFSQTVTAKVRELLDVVKSAKDAIDTDIAGLESGFGPTNDMGADVGAPAPTAGLPPAAPTDDLGDDLGPLGDEDEDSIPLSSSGAAGRAKKESAAFRLTPAMRALRESKNPDAFILNTFRKRLSEGRNPSAAVISTARIFSIDAHDVISIIREAKDAATPAVKKAKAGGTKNGKRPFDKERAVNEAKGRLLYRAKLNRNTLWFDIVDSDGKVVADSVCTSAQRAKVIADNFHSDMSQEKRENMMEDVPVKPLTPADQKASQQGQQAQQQAQQQNQQAASKPAPQAPAQPVQKPAPVAAPNLPGTVAQQNPKLTTPPPGSPKAPTAPTGKPAPAVNDPNANKVPQGQEKTLAAARELTKPASSSTPAPTSAIAPTPNGLGNGQAPQQGGQRSRAPTGSQPMVQQKTSATPALNGQNTTTSQPGGTTQTPTALFSKTTPLPTPGGQLMAGAPKQQQPATESRRFKRKG